MDVQFSASDKILCHKKSQIMYLWGIPVYKKSFVISATTPDVHVLTSNELACLLQIRTPIAIFQCNLLLKRLEFFSEVTFALHRIEARVAVEANKEPLLGTR